MTIYIDREAGSAPLAKYIEALGEPVQLGRFASDFEFAINLQDGQTAAGGIEYKKIPDLLTSLTDGRVYDQIRKMREGYQRLYLLIEGAHRTGKDGVLEIRRWSGAGFEWHPAYGRGNEGWTTQELRNRLETITEFFGVRIDWTYDQQDSARWIVEKYHYWQKAYEDHGSWKRWNQSGHGQQPGGEKAGFRAANLLTATTDLPLVQRWARELQHGGQEKSYWIARHFGSCLNMVLADSREWQRVEWTEKLRKGGSRVRHFSAKTAGETVDEIQRIVKI